MAMLAPGCYCRRTLHQHGFFSPIVRTTRSQFESSKQDIRQGCRPIHTLNHPSNVAVVVAFMSAVGPRIRSVQCESKMQASHRHCHHPSHTLTRQYSCGAVLWQCDTGGGPTRPIVPPVQSTPASLPSATTRPRDSTTNGRKRTMVMGCRRVPSILCKLLL